MKLTASLNNYKEISSRLYGIFFEDINFSIDGGINNNQINNPSCEAVYYDYIKDFYWLYYQIFHARRRFMRRKEYVVPLRYWMPSGQGTLRASKDNPIAPLNPNYMSIDVSGSFYLKNLGYNGGDSTENGGRYLRRQSHKCAIGVKEGHVYDVSAWFRNCNFTGNVVCYVEDKDGNELTSKCHLTIGTPKDGWQKCSATVIANATTVGRFVCNFVGSGTLNADMWYFGDTDCWGKDDPKWSGGKMRKDLVEALRDLNPKFVRFPGGCLVEGLSLNNSYDWTITVGDLEKRGTKYNLWGEAQRDRTYMQSNAIGFYEYFLLSEDLNAEPLPILNAGLACQGRTTETVTEGDEEFNRRLNNILGLIEYANGDPAESEWAKMRADAGHPAPFNLKMIGIGNENWGELYNKNFDIMRKAVKDKYPEVEVVWTAGFDCFQHPTYEERRALFDGKWPEVIVDDHFYRTPQWTIENTPLYDTYPRERNRIFLGEYAANTPWNDTCLPNNYYSALAEAAFLTGLERNADIVVISSYAPLFSRVGGEQWKHNLINFNSLYTMKTANYLVQELYGNNYGYKYLPVDDPAKDGVYTSVTADDQYIYVKAVNVNKQAISYELALEGAEISNKATLTEIYCDDDEACNVLGYDTPALYNIAPVVTDVVAEGGVKLGLKARSVNVVRIALNK